MNNSNSLTVIKKELGRGGALCKEFNRVRLIDAMDWKIEQMYAMEIIRNSAMLQQAEPASIGRSLVDLAVMGLSLSPAKKEAYLIPYRVDGVPVCQASPSYMGLEQIAFRTGMIEGIQTGIVREGDRFDQWTNETGAHIDHRVKSVDNANVTHAYCIVWLSTGKTLVEVMTKQQILACRDAAAKKNGGNIPFVWKGAFREEMYKKCVIRRSWKHWPKNASPRVQAMLEAVERTDPMDFGANDATIVDISASISSDQVGILTDILREAGFPVHGLDRQLQGLASGMGFQNIRSVPMARFEEAVSLLERGLERWKERQSQASEESGSGQAGSTAQTEAT